MQEGIAVTGSAHKRLESPPPGGAQPRHTRKRGGGAGKSRSTSDAASRRPSKPARAHNLQSVYLGLEGRESDVYFFGLINRKKRVFVSWHAGNSRRAVRRLIENALKSLGTFDYHSGVNNW